MLFPPSFRLFSVLLLSLSPGYSLHWKAGANDSLSYCYVLHKLYGCDISLCSKTVGQDEAYDLQLTIDKSQCERVSLFVCVCKSFFKTDQLLVVRSFFRNSIFI